MQYPDGSYYDGEWENDMMHGEGTFKDKEGMIWEGVFINNTYESKIQKKLHAERMLLLKQQEFEKTAVDYFT